MRERKRSRKSLINKLFTQALFSMTLTAAAGAQPYVYFTAGTSGRDVYKVDAPSNTVVATIAFADVDLGALAVTPDGTQLYVLGVTPNVVYAVNTGTFTLDTTIPLEMPPWSLAITPDGKYAYIIEAGQIEIIQTDINTVVSVLPITFAGYEIVFSYDGTSAYITDGTATLHVLRTADNTFLAPIIVSGANLDHIAASPAGPSLYATDTLNSVWFINSATGASRAVTVPHTPWTIAVSPDGSTIYVTEFNALHDYVTDLLAITAGGSIVRHVRATFHPNVGLALSYPDGSFVYVTDGSRSPATAVQTSTFTVGALGPPNPFYVATQPSPYIPLIHYQPNLFFQITLDEAVLNGTFGLGPGNTALGLPQSDLTLKIADVALTIPPNSFKKNHAGGFAFSGNVGGVNVQAVINPSQSGYQFNFLLSNFPTKGIVNPVTVQMIVGDNIGGATTNAQFAQ